MRFLSILFFVSLCPFAISAKPSLEAIRDMIDNGRFSELEATLDDATNAAKQNNDFSHLRKIYGQVFRTSHPDRIAATREWLEVKPESVYARTAAAWQHDAIATHLYAGHHAPYDEDFLAKTEGHRLARGELALAAYEADRDFLPASDALFKRPTALSDEKLYETILPDVMSRYPSIHTLDLASYGNVYTADPSENPSWHICQTYGGMVEGYSPELCIARTFLHGFRSPQHLDRAERLILESDLPELVRDQHAIMTSFQYRKNPANLERILDLHLQSADWSRWSSFIGNARHLSNLSGDPFYFAEAEERFVTILQQKLEDDPLDPNLVQDMVLAFADAQNTDTEKASEIIEQSKLRRIWIDGLRYGQGDWNYWINALSLWQPPRDYDAGTSKDFAPVFRQAIAVSGGGAGFPVSHYLFYLNIDYVAAEEMAEEGRIEESERIKAAISCDYVAMARLAEELCATGNQTGGGCGSTPPRAQISHALDGSDATRQCRSATRLSLRMLMPKPLPIEDVIANSALRDW